MTKVVEQICTVMAVKNNGSSFIVSLEPKKQQCPTCDGKCVKMMKPSELIELPTDLNLVEGDEVVLFMDKKDLSSMVIRVMGIPLSILVLTVALGTYLDVSELALIGLVMGLLVISFIWQVRYLQFNNQIRLKKIDNSKITVEK